MLLYNTPLRCLFVHPGCTHKVLCFCIQDVHMKQYLQRLGVDDLWDEKMADLTPVGTSGTSRLRVKELAHKVRAQGGIRVRSGQGQPNQFIS